ncbi:fibrinogen-like protein 1-like protein [Leucoraja erinacea]|uniref:fibrinogen-like protein 1-like protein n=1 Tax=Leucoraja erinaceus TaxID=7782 RepID=UPI00245424E3|nr:fibrinogen-like protein 1-like protein [Leucoraja erinacea]
MIFHNMLLVFSVVILSAQSLTGSAVPERVAYKALHQKVGNADMVPEGQANKILNVRDLLLKKARYAKDCNELIRQGFKDSGLYVIQPQPVESTPMIVVNCEMEYDCGGWTLLEKKSRQSPLTWNETWTTYEYGFGNVLGDHYLGNLYMHYITSQMWYKVRIVMDQMNDANKMIQRYAEYDMFRVGSSLTGYKLYLGGFTGNGGDAMTVFDNLVDNMPFSTRDQDSDQDSANCALKYGGGWWFNTCASDTPYAMLTQKESIHWQPFCKNCSKVQIMVRSVNMYCPRRGMITKY